jgi:hypothetical protein
LAARATSATVRLPIPAPRGAMRSRCSASRFSSPWRFSVAWLLIQCPVSVW